uniref:LisH domain-containing protein n=1 Tax=Glossina brevipalpis TaxID=37001 RepID=A0A240SWD7_9MUSC
MDVVVLKKDIARLVWDYLKTEELEKAQHIFCKTSPFLEQEYAAFKKCLQTHSFFPKLEEIICEYVNISIKVEQLWPKFAAIVDFDGQKYKLSDKVIAILEDCELTLPTRLGNKPSTSKLLMPECSSLSSGKENCREKAIANPNRKRKIQNSSNENSMSHEICKRRRILEPYCFLIPRSAQGYRNDISGFNGENESCSTSSLEDLKESTSEEISDNDLEDENHKLNKEKPESQSTPYCMSAKKTNLPTPILPGISEVILHNSEFQQKLADNINQVLNTSVNNNSESVHKTVETELAKNDSPSNNVNCETDHQILSSEVLDNMVKDILEATENDPSYNTILEECIEACSARPQTQTIAVQCNMPVTQYPHASTEPPPLVPTQSFAHLSYPHCSDVLTMATHNAPPRTPLIIRTAVAAATSNAITNTQDNNQLISNNSLGSLIDPNFSVSKLIVLNSNECAQKHQQQSQQPHFGVASNENQTLSQMTCLPPSVNSITESADDPLYFDSVTGQLAFPVYLTNEGAILINNDIVGQQLHNNNSPAEDSMALPEPVIDAHINPIHNHNNQTTNTKKDKALIKPNEPPASANSYLAGNKATPSCGIINTKASKSFSTPRKRASHVRTLTFSPRGPQFGVSSLMAPLSTRREHLNRLQRTLSVSSRQDANAEQSKEEDKIPANLRVDTSIVIPEKPIIKNVEILPTVQSNSVINENSSSSCNVPPLFIHEESSNQTVINRDEPKLSQKRTSTRSETNVTVSNTPKRQQSRENAVRACKKQIPQTFREVNEKDKSKNNSCEADNVGSDETIVKDFEVGAVEEWRRLRSVSISDFDMHIREENAKMSQLKPRRKPSTKRRIRRRKSAALKKKEKEIAAMAEESIELDQLDSMDGKINEYTEEKRGKQEENVNLKESQIKISNHTLDGSFEILDKNGHKYQIKDKLGKFNIKIPTPQKAKESEKSKEETKSKLEVIEEETETNRKLIENNSVEYEKRSVNIGVLLETPSKVHSPLYIPPTPGIFAPSLNTPAGKANDVNDAMSASASFLFGSITKSELDTPLHSVVTPGSRFTTLGLKEGTTPPRSNSNTEYSSGTGSYYKPDESENLDQNIDQLLKNSGQKKPPSLRPSNEGDESVKIVKETEMCEPLDYVQEEWEVEIPVEKLKVEPTVLRRVKSLGSEQVEIEDVDPHYTLASGLPEISAAEEEDSSSSSSSSSDSSSSSASNSPANTSKNSSSSPSSSSCSVASRTKQDKEKTSPNLILGDLDNLSSISSTEDDEWQKLELTDNDENSQLISNDGEVRYPLRNWLTPNKDNFTTNNTVDYFECGTSSREMEKQATIKVTLPLKSAEKKCKESKELEMKRERLKEKLKIDASIQKKDRVNSGSSSAPNILAARSVTRIMHAMRDKGKKSTSLPVSTPNPNNFDETQENSKRSMEVLTALNLSAKKQAPKTLIAVLKSADCSESKNKNLRLRLGRSMTNSAYTTQRRCLPIEARPVTRNICKAGKKIVRTPLSFKSGHQTSTLTAQKLLNKIKETTETPALRISPRLRKTIHRTGKKTIIDLPPIKTKITAKVRKPKVAVVKMQKKLNNKKKLTTSKERKNPLWEDSLDEEEDDDDDDDEEEEEEEDKPLKYMKAPVKPKIHMKAKNYMISKKTKKNSEREKQKKTQKHEESKKKIKAAKLLEISDYKLPEMSDIDEKCLILKETDTNDHVDEPMPNIFIDDNIEKAVEINDDDDDTLEDCVLITIDETDTKHFISMKYEGPDEPPLSPAIKCDLSNVKTHVAIDEHEIHTWSVTETILLYTQEPNCSYDEKQISKCDFNKRNTLKKIKKVRINDERVKMTDSVTETQEEDEKQEVSLKTGPPIASSTPILTLKNNSKILTAEKDKSKQQLKGSGTSNSQNRDGSAKECHKSVSPKMQTIDIETILSHIHGS